MRLHMICSLILRTYQSGRLFCSCFESSSAQNFHQTHSWCTNRSALNCSRTRLEKQNKYMLALCCVPVNYNILHIQPTSISKKQPTSRATCLVSPQKCCLAHSSLQMRMHAKTCPQRGLLSRTVLIVTTNGTIVQCMPQYVAVAKRKKKSHCRLSIVPRSKLFCQSREGTKKSESLLHTP